MKNPAESELNIKQKRPLNIHMRMRLQEGLFLLVIAFAIFLCISFLSFNKTDPSWSSSGMDHQITNWGGRVGAFTADVFLSLFGYIAHFFPLMVGWFSWLALGRTTQKVEWLGKSFGCLLLIVSCCGLMSFYQGKEHLVIHAGGILGDLLHASLLGLFNKTGSILLLTTFFLCGVTFFTGLSWLSLANRLAEYIVLKVNKIKSKERGLKSNFAMVQQPIQQVRELKEINLFDKITTPNAAKVMVAPKLELMPYQSLADTAHKLEPDTLPSLSLLNPPSPLAEKPFSQLTFEDLGALVEQRLSDFGVETKVVGVHPGPIITRFELELAPGVKVSKITGLAKDIARSLSTISVRIVEVIPGKSVIGLEIPNENRELVTLREILEAQRYSHARSPATLVLGKDIAGHPMVVDLTKMPHLLVAGTTGSGKSVSLNVMLLSMLFKATPKQLRFILIDPKMLELSVYDGIPHLLTPVITDMKDASNALRWCVAEMDRRYRLMAALGVRNINNYNLKVLEAIKMGAPLTMPSALVRDEASAKTHLEPLPIIVVIADELADMMMVVGKKVEDLIARIAQKARAAGIHLILATQRPSVDVITGLIKANIPTRIAFQVSSRIDSRTILDQQGAEQLLGHGDMLYLPPGAGLPVRVHGAFVTDDEVHRVVAAWRTAGQPEYLQDVTTEATEMNQDLPTGEQDPLYDQAVRIVIESRRASISLVQRRLRIGYNRAARLMEVMEMAGLVSAMDGNGSREVLVNESVSD